MRGIHRDQHQRGGHGFSDGYSVIVNISRKLGCCLRLPGLGKDEIGVRVRLHIEIYDQSGLHIPGHHQRVHVVHVVHSAHLLLDRSGNRLLEGLRIRPDIGGEHLDFRRGDVGKLGDRKAGDRYCAPR